MTKIILVMGLPTSGKSTLSSELCQELKLKNKKVVWLNADKLRSTHDDWDFTEEGRTRQAKRMHMYTRVFELDKPDFIICDMVCALESQREMIYPDYMVWVDTVKQSPYENTNKAFEPVTDYDYRVDRKDSEFYAKDIANILIGYWDE